MGMRDAARIGCSAGAWGDTSHAAGQLLHHGEVDYVVADYPAEVTMALPARARRGRRARRDPLAG